MDKKELIELIEKKYSQREIGEKLNSSQTNIRYWLKKHKLTTKYLNKKIRNNPLVDGNKMICKEHGLTIFSKRKDGRWRCRKCSVDAVKKRRKELKEKSVEYKGGKCNICNYNKCVEALEFHHLNPEEKDFGIGYKGYTRSWEVVKKELDKCIIVCANCHREIHSGIIVL